MHAYLIMAHHRPDILAKLLHALDDPRNAIYLHIDKKSKGYDWNLSVNQAKLMVIPSIDVNWAGYSQVECTYRLLEAACNDDHHDYYHFLTGVTYPIKTQDHLHQFFKDHQGMEFVGFDNKSDFSERVKYHFLFSEEGKIKTFPQKIKCFIRERYRDYQIHRGIDHSKQFGLVCQKGCAYWSITDDFARYVLCKESMIKQLLRHSLSGDEIFMQTLLYNSSFYQRVYNRDDEYEGCLREFAWEHLSDDPDHNFHMANIDYLVNSHRLFALKFEGDDGMAVIDELQRRLDEKHINNGDSACND